MTCQEILLIHSVFLCHIQLPSRQAFQIPAKVDRLNIQLKCIPIGRNYKVWERGLDRVGVFFQR